MQRNKDFNFMILFLVLIKILIHVPALLEGGYGIFRDELYYLACAAHLSSGYVDQPPLSIWVLSSWVSIFGDHWQVIRIVPVIFGGLTMLIILNLVQELGGGRLAIFLAGAAFLSEPINIGFSSFYSMNSLDLFFWALCFYSAYHALEKPEKDLNWVILGVAVGLGLMNKRS
jgi:4-amino-4-deoxy-L-arabinose transferase-like glycosyltransferase